MYSRGGRHRHNGCGELHADKLAVSDYRKLKRGLICRARYLNAPCGLDFDRLTLNSAVFVVPELHTRDALGRCYSQSFAAVFHGQQCSMYKVFVAHRGLILLSVVHLNADLIHAVLSRSRSSKSGQSRADNYRKHQNDCGSRRYSSVHVFPPFQLAFANYNTKSKRRFGVTVLFLD